MAVVREWSCKGNTAVLKGDELWFRYRGKLDAEIALSAAAFIKQARAAHEKPLFFVGDVEGAEPDAGFRKNLAEAIPIDTFRGLVMIKAGLVQRLAQKAMAIGAMLASKSTPPMTNVDTAEEAAAWIAVQRKAELDAA